ncbi:Abi family protein [Fulvivirga maritima]|uniref:Abi family protein n=1 Tax=Fulvivirga maritima TaxID=2904247 RepID=UPI001F40EED8|nr:Abi family protein [Fulvivirga maritima]UII26316.1 Abi family protein [Fulvivirga maritima]
MAKRIYHKAPLSFQDQLELLKTRGLTVADEEEAICYLQEISYYRLSAYFLPCQSIKNQFNQGITFKDIINTYSFNRELRLLVFDCIERVEVAIRTQFIYKMAIHYNDSHWQDDQRHFITPFYNRIGKLIDPYNDFQAIISRAKTVRNPEVFIKHYMREYSSPSNPPAWMNFELLTMGDLSHLFRGLRNNSDKKRIADFFDVHHKVFASWLHAITYVRNICAHHARLWNRDLAIEPDRLKKPVGPWIGPRFQNNKRVFYFICVLKYLLLRANPSNSLRQKLQALFTKYPNVPIKYLGIPSNPDGTLMDWINEPLWQ